MKKMRRKEKAFWTRRNEQIEMKNNDDTYKNTIHKQYDGYI
jgi:hypothetical protein